MAHCLSHPCYLLCLHLIEAFSGVHRTLISVEASARQPGSEGLVKLGGGVCGEGMKRERTPPPKGTANSARRRLGQAPEFWELCSSAQPETQGRRCACLAGFIERSPNLSHMGCGSQGQDVRGNLPGCEETARLERRL